MIREWILSMPYSRRPEPSSPPTSTARAPRGTLTAAFIWSSLAPRCARRSRSSIDVADDEVEAPEDRHDVRHVRVLQQVRKHADVRKGCGADLEAVGLPSA